MTAIVLPEIWAPDFEDATKIVRDVQEKLTGILALNRQAAGRPVAIVLEQEGRDETRFRVISGGQTYTGNLLGGSLSGEDQASLIRQYEGAGADPLVRLCCDLYAEALAESSVDAQFLRTRLVNPRAPVGRADDCGSGGDKARWHRLPGRHNTTNNAAPRVYAYLDQMLSRQGSC